MSANFIELNPPERSRTYHFADGQSVTFTNVTKLEVRPSGKHRIETQSGQKAFVAPSWLWVDIDTDNWTL
jgi:hypothetical protein